jgi:two-component system nitrogen regulation response regulator GlnG
MIDQFNRRYGIDDYFLATNDGQIYAKVIRDIEKMLIKKALERSLGNQIAAARMLGINRNTLHAKIKKFNINVKKFKS